MFAITRLRSLAAIFFVAAWVLLATVAQAHPAPSVLHDYIVKLTPQELTLQSYLRISPELVPEVFRKIDLDNDGRVSDAERENWVKEHASHVKLALNGVRLNAAISPAPPLGKEDLLVSIDHPVTITYTATLTQPVSGKQRIQVTYGDNYLAYDEYYISVAGDVANDQRPQSVSKPQYPAVYNIVYHMPTLAEAANVPDGQLAAAPWTAGRAQPTAAAGAAPAAATIGTGSTASTTGVGQILDTLRTYKGDVGTGFGLLLLAMLLGALHAMTPGHGKTMVASYLIGSKGRVRDAALLGGVVTFTHTAGIVVLGLVLLLASNFSMPRALQPALELASGVLVVLLGAYLFLTRWREVRAGRSAPLAIRAGAASPWPALASASASPMAAVAQSATVPVRRAGAGTSAGHTHDHEHGHTADHTHPHNDHSHGHPHEPHSLTHTHGGHTHTHAPVSGGVSPRALIGLGISGGIVPCPDALAILLLAASVGQFALGLGLVMSFSVGLAAVLISLGVALVKVKGALERGRLSSFSQSDLWTRWVPVASAAVVVLVGALMVLSSLGSRWG